MWDLPRPGAKAMSPALAAGFFSAVPPEKKSCSSLLSSLWLKYCNRLCLLLTYSNYLFLRWSKALKQRLITNEFCVPSWKWWHLQSRPCPERALENCKAAACKGPTGKQRKKHLRAEDFPPEKGSTSSPSQHHYSHRDTCVCVCVCVHVCVYMYVCPTEGQSISHKHYDSRALKYPCKSPVVHVIPPSMK